MQSFAPHGDSRSPRGRRAAFVLGAGLSLALALTACNAGSPSPADPGAGDIVEGGTLNIGLPGDPGNLDPTYNTTLTSGSVYNVMCEGLYNSGPDGVVYPQLASHDLEWSEDGMVATVALRENVLFQDGTPFNADAVKYTIDRFLTMESSSRRTELSMVKELKVVDEHTVEFHLTELTAPGAFDVMLLARATGIISPTAMEKGEDKFSEHPVCVGPFKFESRIAQTSITLVKDPTYYDADKVHLDKIVFHVITDPTVATTNLRSGSLDVVERVAPADVAMLEAEGVKVQSIEGLGFIDLTFNLENKNGVTAPHEPLDTPWAKDPNVRLAMEKAIDKDALNRAVWAGMHAPACGFMAPSSPLATDQTLSCHEHDPDEARRLLEASGYELPITIEYLAANNADMRRAGEVIKEMADAVGFDVQLKLVESTAMSDMIFNGEYDMQMNVWSGRGDADANATRFLATDSARGVGGYSNARVDELLVTARSTMDNQVRIEAYDEIDRIIKKDMPQVYLVRPVNLVGYAAKVGGLDYRPNGLTAAAYAYFTK